MPLGLLKSAKNRGHRSVMTSEAKSEKVAMIESASSQRLLPTSPESVTEQAFIYMTRYLAQVRAGAHMH